MGGLSEDIGKRIETKVVAGYNNVKEIATQIERRGNNLIIKGVELKGDSQDFCSYLQASFALIGLGERRNVEK